MRVNKKEIFLGVVLLVFVTLTYLVWVQAPKKSLRVSFLNVGQGDSILFQTPTHANILIDGGRDKQVISKLGQELPINTKTIDLVIATHSDSDHITGLIEVIKKYEVNVLLTSTPDDPSELNKELIQTANERGVRVEKISKPMIIKTTDGLMIKILFPVGNMNKKYDEAESNNTSIVTQFVFGEVKVLLTGDLSASGENFLADKYGAQLKSTILKLGHHGSDTSTSPQFLQVVKPDVAVVSAGENNSFGHPHRSVLELCEKFGITVFSTINEGTVSFETDGINIWKE